MTTSRTLFTTITPDTRTCSQAHTDIPVCAHGVLPGETATVAIIRRKKKHSIAQPLFIHTKNVHRVKPHEPHYQLCSPWQIMDYGYQIETKKQFLATALEAFPETTFSFASASERLHYRTAIGYGFTMRDGELQLAMRGHEDTTPLRDGCALASPTMNKAALHVLHLLRQKNISDSQLLRLVIRESKTNGYIMFGLYVYGSTFPELPRDEFSRHNIVGYTVFENDPKSNLPQPIQELFHVGEQSLTETFGNLTISYPITSFFQNNIPLYLQALKDIASHIQPTENILDIYSGVGTIGLSVAAHAKKITAIESSKSMVKFAKHNAQQNHINNYEAHALSAEDTPADFIASDMTVITNPTRKGIHPNLRHQLLTIKPKQIIYLSCNVLTLQRDLTDLAQEYNLTFAKGYDFYPHTPHQESLVILERK